MNLFKKIHLKILAVLCAVFLWLFVVGVENYVNLFPTELPVKVINLGQNVSVANEIGQVKVHYRSPDGTVNVNPNDFELFLDASGLGEGDYNLPVNFSNKNVRVTVVAVEPAQLELKLEAITSKDIDITKSIVGAPARDYEIKSLVMSADKVKISGAASALAKLQSLPLKITLDGTETADFSRKITLEAPAEWKLGGKTVSFDPPVIQADIQIRKNTSTGTDSDALNGNTGSGTPVQDIPPVAAGDIRKTLMVEIVPEQSLSSAVKELLPRNLLVTVEGQPADVEGLDNLSVKLNLKSSAIQNGVYQVNTADLKLPAGKTLEIITFSPEKVLVKF